MTDSLEPARDLADRGRKGVAGRRVGEGDQHGGGADLVATAGVAA